MVVGDVVGDVGGRLAFLWRQSWRTNGECGATGLRRREASWEGSLRAPFVSKVD